MITNDLIRISLLIESLLDAESLQQSVGGTPKKDKNASSVQSLQEGIVRRQQNMIMRKHSQLSMCSSSKQSISIDESSMLINMRRL